MGFGLHYDSSEWNTTNIAHGWSLSVNARLTGDTVQYGSGTVRVEDTTILEGNLTVIRSSNTEMLFRSDGKLQSTRDLYTKVTQVTFTYDVDGYLATITNMYDEVTTLNRDSNGTVTSIVSPHVQITYLAIDENSDLVEVQYEDTTSYTFEYERHLMTLEREPNGNEFLHFFDEHGKVVKVIDAEQGEWLFNSATQSTSGTHKVTRASGDAERFARVRLVL